MQPPSPRAAVLASLALAAMLSAAPQETAIPAPAVASNPRLLALDQLVSVPVVVRPGAPADAADGRAGEVGEADAGRQGEGTAERDAAAKAQPAVEIVGTLRDLVVDTETKQITLAIVQTAEGGRALPLSRLTWDDAGRQWLVASREEIAQGKPCDGIDLAKLHGAAIDAGNGDDAKEADKAPSTRLAIFDSRYDLASIFGRRDVMARDGRIGAGLGIVLETTTGWLAFLRVATGQGDLAVPTAALQVPGPTSASEAHRVHLAMDKAALANAPMLGKDPKSSLDDAAFRAEVYRFFGVPIPAYERLGQDRPTAVDKR